MEPRISLSHTSQIKPLPLKGIAIILVTPFVSHRASAEIMMSGVSGASSELRIFLPRRFPGRSFV